ncbi:MAG: hypothetical protein JXR70_03550 [Spirochaetales bacterium]|nr:hypothetical protein [Spirochaetales bacterium]
MWFKRVQHTLDCKRSILILNKINCFVIFLCLILKTAGFGEQCGDIDNNGFIDIVDALAAARISQGIYSKLYSDCQADIDNNGIIEMNDGILIADFYIGNLQKLETCGSCLKDAMSAEEAGTLILEKWVPLLIMNMDSRKGLVILQYKELLSEGSVIALRDESFLTQDIIRLTNPSWLFFVDFDPYAHFGHEVKVIILSSTNGQTQFLDSRWWPQINDKNIFSTVKERQDPDSIIFSTEAKTD